MGTKGNVHLLVSMAPITKALSEPGCSAPLINKTIIIPRSSWREFIIRVRGHPDHMLSTVNMVRDTPAQSSEQLRTSKEGCYCKRYCGSWGSTALARCLPLCMLFPYATGDSSLCSLCFSACCPRWWFYFRERWKTNASSREYRCRFISLCHLMQR